MRSFALPWIPHDDVILPADCVSARNFDPLERGIGVQF
jgi:hypothetical protein